MEDKKALEQCSYQYNLKKVHPELLGFIVSNIGQCSFILRLQKHMFSYLETQRID